MRQNSRAIFVAATLTWCAELVLARVSGQPQRPLHLLLAAGLVSVCALIGAFATRLPPARRAGAWLDGAAAAFPAATIAGAVVMLALQPEHSAFVSVVAGGGLATAALALGARIPGASHRWLPFAALGTAAVIAWLAQRGLPPLALIATILAAWAAIGVLASQRFGLAWAVVFAAGVAVLPAGIGRPLAPVQFSDDVAPAATSGRDLVLITTDTLRSDTAAGMQAFQRLAARGRSFDAQSSSTWTLPSIASIHTGVPNTRHGAGKYEGKAFALSEDVPTLAEQLARAGYDTAAVLAYNPWLDTGYGFARGFAHYDHGNTGDRAWALPSYGNRSKRGSLPVAAYLAWATLQALAQEDLAVPLELWLWDRADDVVARAERVLAQRREAPLFLWVHFMDAHIPYRHVLGSAKVPADIRRQLIRYDGDLGGWIAKQSDGDGMRQHVRSAYEHEAARLDVALVRLLDQLDRDGRDPLILWTSDHGEEIWEHGQFGHGHAFFQEIISVPLVIAGAPSDADSNYAGLIDVAPTLLDAAGLDGSGADGASLLSKAEPRVYVTENLHHPQEGRSGGRYVSDRWYAVRERDWKWIDAGDGAGLFDLATDPGERSDESSTHADLVARMRERAPATTASSTAPEIDDSTRDALRALGYIE